MDARFSQMPRALAACARWQRLGDDAVPALLAHPNWQSESRVPVVLWMHGRTVRKELDPGRYLRWLRAGIGTCAVDLPGHGERFDAELQAGARTLDVVTQMAAEIDGIVSALRELQAFDLSRLGVGGMSAGGMAALARLCQAHTFRCASVEATTGSWEHQCEREMFRGRSLDEINAVNPVRNLDEWLEIPLQAIHATLDEWVSIEGQREFLKALRRRYAHPETIELVEFDHTGAPHEHAGFGRHSAEAKERQVAFYRRWLLEWS